MSTADHHALGVWEKWTRFRRFPGKLLLHVALLAALTLQILLLNKQDAAYTRAMHRTFSHYFMPRGVDDGLGRHVIFTNAGFLSSLSEAASNYFEINRLSTVAFLYRNNATDSGNGASLGLTPTPFTMRLHLAEDYHTDPLPPLSLHYVVAHPQDLGPFSVRDTTDGAPLPPTLAVLLDALLAVTLDMVLCNTAKGNGAGGDQCFCWHVTSQYSFRNGGNAHLTLHPYIDAPCFREASFVNYLFSDVNTLNLVLVVLAVAYLALILRSMAASLALYLRVKRAYHATHPHDHPFRRRYATWAAVPWKVKRKFFSTYLLLIGLGTLLTLVSVLLNVVQAHNYSPSVLPHKLCAGLGTLLLWTGLLRFLQPYPALYSLIPTLNAAAPRLLPFLAGFLPIFLAFALLGISLFGRDVVIFSTLPHTLKSMWSLMNGDSLHDIINASHSVRPLVSNVYNLAYIALAIYVVGTHPPTHYLRLLLCCSSPVHPPTHPPTHPPRPGHQHHHCHHGGGIFPQPARPTPGPPVPETGLAPVGRDGRRAGGEGQGVVV